MDNTAAEHLRPLEQISSHPLAGERGRDTATHRERPGCGGSSWLQRTEDLADSVLVPEQKMGGAGGGAGAGGGDFGGRLTGRPRRADEDHERPLLPSGLPCCPGSFLPARPCADFQLSTLRLRF